MNMRPGVRMTQVATLAIPFVAVSVWLGITVAGFGATAVVQGALSGLALTAAVVLLAGALGRWGAVPAATLYVGGVLLCAADAVSWVIQGSSFNDRFFAHVN